MDAPAGLRPSDQTGDHDDQAPDGGAHSRVVGRLRTTDEHEGDMVDRGGEQPRGPHRERGPGARCSTAGTETGPAPTRKPAPPRAPGPPPPPPAPWGTAGRERN